MKFWLPFTVGGIVVGFLVASAFSCGTSKAQPQVLPAAEGGAEAMRGAVFFVGSGSLDSSAGWHAHGVRYSRTGNTWKGISSPGLRADELQCSFLGTSNQAAAADACRARPEKALCFAGYGEAGHVRWRIIVVVDRPSTKFQPIRQGWSDLEPGCYRDVLKVSIER